MSLPSKCISMTCGVCGTTFELAVWELKRSAGHYSSLSCASRSRLLGRPPQYPKVTGKCPYCHGEIIAPNRKFDRPSRPRQYCSRSCHVAALNKRRPVTDAHRERLSIAAKERFLGKSQPLQQRLKRSQSIKGNKHWNWQGGKTAQSQAERNNTKLKYWRHLVFQRDDYTCQSCGVRGGLLNAHHILPWSTHPELRYVLSNGLTLCLTCHANTDSFRGKGGARKGKVEA